MSLYESYKAAVKARGGQWRSMRRRAAAVTSRIVSGKGRVAVSDLCTELGCDREFARHTLRDMEREGLLVHWRGSGSGGPFVWTTPGASDPKSSYDGPTMPVEPDPGAFAKMRAGLALEDELRVARGQLHLAAIRLHEVARTVEIAMEGLLKIQHPKHADDKRAIKVLRKIAEAASLHHHQVAAAIGIGPSAPLEIHGAKVETEVDHD